MPAAGSNNRHCNAWTRQATAAASLMVCIGLQVYFAGYSLTTISGNSPRKITQAGHIDARYAVTFLTYAQKLGCTSVVDPNVNAALPTIQSPAGTGRWLALVEESTGVPNWVSSDLGFLTLAIVPPSLLAFATLATGTSAFSTALAPWLAAAVWWLRPNQQLIVAGSLELTLLGPLVTAYLASLYGFHRHASIASWIGLIAISCVGWHLLPVIWSGVAIVGAIYWLMVAHRHTPIWNGLAVLSFLLGIAPSAPPLVELMTRPSSLACLSPSGMAEWLNATYSTQSSLDYVTIGIIGTVFMISLVRHCAGSAHRSNNAEWLLGCASLGIGIGLILRHNGLLSSQSVDMLGLVCVYLVLPTVSSWFSPARLLPALIVILTLAFGLAMAAARINTVSEWGIRHLEVGWSSDEIAWREQLQSIARPTARVLWERQSKDRLTPTMLPLEFGLPVLTGHESGGNAEPWSFNDGDLGGRRIADWTDEDLQRFCQRWNIGWIRVASPASKERFSRWSLATSCDAKASSGGDLFSINRNHSYFLKGRGRLESAAPNEIVLTDVVPDGGEAVVSFCWHPGWSAAPSRVNIEPESSTYDSVSLIRLRLESPVSRLALRWISR